jgi:hypothetical protein
MNTTGESQLDLSIHTLTSTAKEISSSGHQDNFKIDGLPSFSINVNRSYTWTFNLDPWDITSEKGQLLLRYSKMKLTKFESQNSTFVVWSAYMETQRWRSVTSDGKKWAYISEQLLLQTTAGGVLRDLYPSRVITCSDPSRNISSMWELPLDMYDLIGSATLFHQRSWWLPCG